MEAAAADSEALGAASVTPVVLGTASEDVVVVVDAVPEPDEPHAASERHAAARTSEPRDPRRRRLAVLGPLRDRAVSSAGGEMTMRFAQLM